MVVGRLLLVGGWFCGVGGLGGNLIFKVFNVNYIFPYK